MGTITFSTCFFFYFMVTGKEYLTKYDIKSPQTKRQIKIIPETLLLWQKNPMIFKPSSSGDLTSGFGTAALSTREECIQLHTEVSKHSFYFCTSHWPSQHLQPLTVLTSAIAMRCLGWKISPFRFSLPKAAPVRVRSGGTRELQRPLPASAAALA